MLIREYSELLDISDDIFNNYNMNNIAYFDIETTGFDKDADNIILISLGKFYNNKSFCIKQYYAESLEDEKNLLNNFLCDLKGYNVWCSYNGIAFDEPFVISRMEKHNISLDTPKNHVDLYRSIRPYYKQLGIDRCNLKSIEKYIGIKREDQIDGGISVDLYKEFLITGEDKIRDIIMLHNYEDVLNLPKIHEFIFEVENNKNLVRENVITEKQLKYLKSLLKKYNLLLSIDLERMSKKAASRIIDQILKGCRDCDELNNIINNSY